MGGEARHQALDEGAVLRRRREAGRVIGLDGDVVVGQPLGDVAAAGVGQRLEATGGACTAFGGERHDQKYRKALYISDGCSRPAPAGSRSPASAASSRSSAVTPMCFWPPVASTRRSLRSRRSSGSTRSKISTPCGGEVAVPAVGAAARERRDPLRRDPLRLGHPAQQRDPVQDLEADLGDPRAGDDRAGRDRGGQARAPTRAPSGRGWPRRRSRSPARRRALADPRSDSRGAHKTIGVDAHPHEWEIGPAPERARVWWFRRTGEKRSGEYRVPAGALKRAAA